MESKIDRKKAIIEDKYKVCRFYKADFNLAQLFSKIGAWYTYDDEGRGQNNREQKNLSILKLAATCAYNLAAGHWKVAKYPDMHLRSTRPFYDRKPMDTFGMFYLNIVPTFMSPLAKYLANIEDCLEAGDKETAIKHIKSAKKLMYDNVAVVPSCVTEEVNRSIDFTDYVNIQYVSNVNGKSAAGRKKTHVFLKKNISDYEILNTIGKFIVHADGTPLVPRDKE